MREKITLKSHLITLGAVLLFTTLIGLLYSIYYYEMYTNSLARSRLEIVKNVRAEAALEGWAEARIEERVEEEYDALLERNRLYRFSWFEHVMLDALYWWPYVVLTPAMLLLCQLFPFRRRGFLRAAAAHFAGGLLFGLSKRHIQFFFAELAFGCEPGDLTFGSALIAAMPYWIFVAGYSGVTYYLRFKERETHSKHLERQLARAQLDVLKMQLHPHFLFNALQAVSTLMARDVVAADRIILRLCDLLRMSLSRRDRQEVTLREELEFLKGYIEIERIRFGDRLEVCEEVAPEALEARLPSLVLQPLVENAVTHGISRIAAQGRIVLKAEIQNGFLQIEVRDNGPGPESNSPSRIGLTNTRERIERLYGGRGRIELFSPKEGGAVVRLKIPHVKERSSDEEDPNADRR
jgi:signal transduction histidine kinase